nr:GNAT family N-acetyltransferase [Candidatus Gracilibacteria bacterium]
MIDIHIADELEKELCYKIREDVFTYGQKVPKKIDSDGLDETSTHVILYYSKIPVGTARIRIIDNNLKLERISILEQYRGKGLGKELMKFLIEYSKTKNIDGIVMNAQAYLQSFYEKFGFKKEGEIFKSSGIPHIRMYLSFK